MDLGLRGRRVLITGGSQGIGYAVAAGFMTEGCDVVIVARDQSRLETATATLAQLGTGQVEAASIDLTQGGAAEELAEAYPDTDILVNNAGDPLARGLGPQSVWLRQSHPRHVCPHARPAAQSHHQHSRHWRRQAAMALCLRYPGQYRASRPHQGARRPQHR